MNHSSVRISSAGCHHRSCRRQRLLIAAVCHAQFVEHQFAHQRGKSLACGVHHELLLDRDAAARVDFLCSRQNIHADRRRVRRFLSIEDLYQRGQRFVYVVSWKTMDGKSCRVRHQSPQRHLFIFRKLVFRHFPCLELFIHVLIECQHAVFDEVKRSCRRHRFADRPCLEQRFSCYRRARSRFNHAISLGPSDLVILDHGDAQPRYVVKFHQLQEVHPQRCLVLPHRQVDHRRFHAMNP